MRKPSSPLRFKIETIKLNQSHKTFYTITVEVLGFGVILPHNSECDDVTH